MNLRTDLRKLLASLEESLVDNGRDIDAGERRLAELADERRTIIRGIEGIRRELTKLEGD